MKEFIAAKHSSSDSQCCIMREPGTPVAYLLHAIYNMAKSTAVTVANGLSCYGRFVGWCLMALAAQIGAT